MTSPVNGAAATSAIAALIGQAVAGQVSARKGPGTASSSKKAEKRASAQDKPELAELIAARAEGLNPDAPDYRNRLLRLVIEASLLHEFGSHLLNAPKFQAMVDQVLHELAHAPQLKRDVDMVLEGLSKAPRTTP